MFDLNEQIKKWRSQLEVNEAYQKSDIEELESHLLDEIDQLIPKDLNEEEAFWIAAHRIGKLKDLNQEFYKVNRDLIWRKRVILLFGGYFLINFILLLTKVFSQFLYLFRNEGFFNVSGIVSGIKFPLDISFLILVLSGLILYLIFSRKSKLIKIRKFISNRIRNLKKYQIAILIVPSILLINFGDIMLNIFGTKYYNIYTFGKISAVNSINIFLITTLLSIIFISCFLFHAKYSMKSD